MVEQKEEKRNETVAVEGKDSQAGDRDHAFFNYRNHSMVFSGVSISVAFTTRREEHRVEGQIKEMWQVQVKQKTR